MSSSDSIARLYMAIKSKFGPVRAKNTVSAVLENIITDLETEGLEVSEQRLNERLANSAGDFELALKDEVA